MVDRNLHLETAAIDLTRKLGGAWRGRHGMCRCPAHEDRSPSLSIRVGDRALLFKCFAGCSSRDVIRAILRIDDQALCSTRDDNKPTRARTAIHLGRHRALRLFDESRAIEGTPAELYLRRRRIALFPPVLRFHPHTPVRVGDRIDFRPAMIAALHDAGRLVAVQRTFFERDDARRARDLADPRMTLGRPRHGAVILGEATDVLGLAEGVETAISAMILLGIPVWATLGSERMHQIAVPDRVTRLVLLPDNDLAGEIAEARARASYSRPDRLIETCCPPNELKDWNDLLRLGGKGLGGLAAASGLMVGLPSPQDQS